MSPAQRDIEAVRQELATTPLGDSLVELATMARVGGTWERSGGPDGLTTVAVVSPVGAVVRRVGVLCEDLGLPRPTLAMRAPGGMRTTTTWAARLDAGVIAELDIVTASGAPRGRLPTWEPDPAAAIRAVVLVAASVSGPQQRAHFEVRPPTARLVDDLVALFADVGVAITHDESHDRLVSKSSASLVRILEVAGAERAAADHAEQRARRDLRNRVVRLTNADEANVARAVQAAGRQVDDLVALRDAAGWERVPEHLREVALVRLANPTVTMTQLGQLCDPPVGKSTVHRRMAVLRQLAAKAVRDASD